MNDDLDLDNWEPEPIKLEVEQSMLSPSPFRVDPKDKKRRAVCILATSRRFLCPGCGMPRHVEPTYSGEEWHYFAQCSYCGARWCNAYHLMRRCQECGAKVPMTSRNPDGICNCQGESVRPFTSR
jgi:hypothetical protein